MTEAAANSEKNKGGRPKGSRTKKVSVEVALQSPEVKAAINDIVADAVAKATAAYAEQMAAKRAEHGTEAPANDPGDQGLARRLALAIAEVADQGTNRKRVAPEIMEARRQARERMEGFILDFVARDMMPEYELIRAVYLNEELVEPTYTDRDHVMRRTKIEWSGVPNEGMTPANEPARIIFGAFMESIGGATPNVTRQIDPLKPREHTGLKVMHKPETAQTPQVTRANNSGVKRLGRRQAGDVVETNVLGTVAEPARQIA